MGAKFTGKGIMPDEHVQPQLSFSYDAKRDRWNGYNLNEHAAIIEEHNKVEMAKRKLKAEKLQEELLSGKLPEGSVKVYTCVTMICVSLGKCALKYWLVGTPLTLLLCTGHPGQ